MGDALGLRKLPNRLGDDGDAVFELRFGHDQGRGESNDVAVGGLGEQAVVLQGHAQIPGRAAVGRVVDENRIQQTFAAYAFDEGQVANSGLQALPKLLTPRPRILHQSFLLHHLW